MLALAISCYLLGVNHSRQSFMSDDSFFFFFFFPSGCRIACDSLLCFLICVIVPEQVQFLQQAKLCTLVAVTTSVQCCCCKGLQIYSSASDQPVWLICHFNDSWLLNSIVHFLPLHFRIMWHWPTVLIISSVTYIYNTSGFLIWFLLVFFFCCVCLKLCNRNWRIVFKYLFSTFLRHCYNKIFWVQRF